MKAEENNINTSLDAEGNVSISSDVVATIASIAAKSINGVSGMLNSFTGGFAEFLGKKNPSKGVKVQIDEKNVRIDMYIIVEYGVKIPDVAWEIQEKTKNEVEAMTGLCVTAVNINIEGVNTSKAAEENAAPANEALDEAPASADEAE